MDMLTATKTAASPSNYIFGDFPPVEATQVLAMNADDASVLPVASKWLAGRHRFVSGFVLEALRLGSGHLRVALEEYMVVATTWTPGLEGRSIADLIEKLKLRAATVSVVSDVDGAFAWSSFSDAAFTQINGLAWTRTQDRGQQPSFYENELRSVRGKY